MKQSSAIALCVLILVLIGGCAVMDNEVRRTSQALQTPQRSEQADNGSFAEPIVEGAPLVHHFQFESHLNDSLPTEVSLSVHPNTDSSGFSNGSWQWQATNHPGGGLVLLTGQISNPENYAIGFRIRFNEVGPGWIKILSFRGERADGGLYFYDGHLQLYPFDVNTDVIFQPNTYYDFILSRSSDQLTTVYVVQRDGSITKVYEEQDRGDESVPIQVDGRYEFRFFTDDTATTAEWTTGGSVRSIRVWDGTVDRIRLD